MNGKSFSTVFRNEFLVGIFTPPSSAVFVDAQSMRPLLVLEGDLAVALKKGDVRVPSMFASGWTDTLEGRIVLTPVSAVSGFFLRGEITTARGSGIVSVAVEPGDKRLDGELGVALFADLVEGVCRRMA